MSHYLYFNYENESLVNRFDLQDSYSKDNEINGLKEWKALTGELMKYLSGDNPEYNDNRISRQALIDRLSNNSFFENRDLNDLYESLETTSTEELILIVLRSELMNNYALLPENICPRLFISHRQTDTAMALKLALYARHCGFSYWIDVEDPNLKQLEKRKDEEKIKKLLPLLTACIIEMALINCTHVLAYISPNSKGSLWIPYEYGRITKIPEYFGKACANISQDLNPADFPEYMYLGVVADTRTKVVQWLKREKKVWDKHDKCRPEDLVKMLKEQSLDWLDKILKEYISESVKESLIIRGPLEPLEMINVGKLPRS